MKPVDLFPLKDFYNKECQFDYIDNCSGKKLFSSAWFGGAFSRFL